MPLVPASLSAYVWHVQPTEHISSVLDGSKIPSIGVVAASPLLAVLPAWRNCQELLPHLVDSVNSVAYVV